jgi:hypothetical protein
LNCPFCAEVIKDEAFVCKHCRRDISIHRPLLLRLCDHARQIAALADQLEELKAAVAAQTTPVSGERVEKPQNPQSPEPQTMPIAFSAIAGYLALAFLLLVGAHYLIVWTFDLDRRYLFAATVIIPSFAALCSGTIGRVSPPTLIVVAFVFGVVSVAAMILDASWGNISNAPPHGRSEWANDIFWVLSVALSFLTGALTRRALAKGSGARVVTAVKWLLDSDRTEKAGNLIELVGHLAEVVTPVATAVGSIVAGAGSVLK